MKTEWEVTTTKPNNRRHSVESRTTTFESYADACYFATVKKQRFPRAEITVREIPSLDSYGDK